MFTSRCSSLFDAWVQAFTQGLSGIWRMVRLGALVLVVGLSPSSYRRSNLSTICWQIYTHTVSALPWFTAMSALISLVLIRVVVVTAQSYGLSQYALEMVVRVLVLELIPLCAAMFIALRSNVAFTDPFILTSQLNAPVLQHGLKVTTPSLAVFQYEWLAHVLASAFSVLALATVSSVLALVLAYVSVHGFSPWGLPGYTRTVGHVFDLAVTLGFGLKTLFFSLAVAIVPLVASLEVPPRGAATNFQPGLVRLFLALLLIEALSLSVKYI